MYTRVVTCGTPDCERPAKYKIAAPWQNGSFAELKCYGLSCEAHTESVFHDAQRRGHPVHLVPGESEGEIGIYDIQPGKVERLIELEKRFTS